MNSPVAGRARQVAAPAIALLIAIVFLSGCAPDIIFFADPAYSAVVGNADDLERRLQEVARETGRRLEVEWDPSTSMATAWLETRLQETQAPVVVLSPYFSLFASQFADTLNGRRLIAYGGGSPEQENLTRVVYDRVPAQAEAGRLLASWEDAAPGRWVAVLFLRDTDERRAELEALTTAYETASGRLLSVEAFASVPDREDVRRVVRDFMASGVNGVAVHVGASNRYALEVLQTEPVVFATDAAMGSESLADSLLYSIETPPAVGLAAALSAMDLGAGGLLTVEATIEGGEGYRNPQLSRPEPAPNDETAADSGS